MSVATTGLRVLSAALAKLTDGADCFRALPKRGGDLRQRFDGSIAGALLAAMILL